MLPQGPRNLPNNRERQLPDSTRLVHSLQLWLRSLRFIASNPVSWLLVLCAALVVACSPQEKSAPGAIWEYADLRTLSQPDQQISSGDFIAGYARPAGSDFQLRFDLLDMSGPAENDFYVALDYRPGGSHHLPINGESDIAWDTLLFLPADGLPQAFSPASPTEISLESGVEFQLPVQEDLIPRIVRIPWQDYVLVSINQASIPHSSKGIEIQAFSTAPGVEKISDSIGPFSSNGTAPGQAALLLTFWNSFPAYSPAQALRKWDGAHTGPYGERHGLSILLDNVRRYTVPVVLLDLRAPAVLSALDHLGAVPLVRDLQTAKLLTLPDSLPGSPSFPLFPDGLPEWTPAYYPDYANLVSERFDLPPSDMLYLPRTFEDIPEGYSLYFSLPDQNSRLEPRIPLPPQTSQDPQATADGLPLTIRKNLLNNALNLDADPASYPLLVLGGDLQDSAFADPASAAATLSYIANHPWIKPLNRDDLHVLPRQTEPQYLPGITKPSDTALFAPSPMLSILPEPEINQSNPLYQAAWESALSLYAPLPPEPDNLPQLRSNYTGQPGILLSAAQWADEPYSRLDCQSDLDLDGIPECILSSEEQFAVIDQLGARLMAYFYRSDSGVHQIIAATAQLIVGLGDPSTWQLEALDGADPAGIHGAFSDTPPPWSRYLPTSMGDGITFTSPDQQIIKTYTLKEDGLVISYHSSEPAVSRIPIAIDPWRRFSPGWSEQYLYLPIEGGYQISAADDIAIKVLSDLPMQAFSFTDSLELLDSPEDPNFDYPRGHYLPFPFTVLEFNGQGDFSIRIEPVP